MQRDSSAVSHLSSSLDHHVVGKPGPELICDKVRQDLQLILQVVSCQVVDLHVDCILQDTHSRQLSQLQDSVDANGSRKLLLLIATMHRHCDSSDNTIGRCSKQNMLRHICLVGCRLNCAATVPSIYLQQLLCAVRHNTQYKQYLCGHRWSRVVCQG